MERYAGQRIFLRTDDQCRHGKDLSYRWQWLWSLEPNYEATTSVDDYGLVAGEDLGTFVLPSVDGAKKIVFYEICSLMRIKRKQR